ncbi:MAG: hypothetical protein ABUS49_11195 [Acidobacteriota bacterium]
MFRFSAYTAFVLACALPAWGGNCPNPPVPGVDSSRLPADVCIPSGFTGLTIDFFDDYSWRAFTAMVWPAARRETPDPAARAGAPGPRVFETFHPLWEVFHEDGSAPSAEPGANACSAKTGFGDVVLASFSGVHDIGQTADGSLLGPLVAQNGRYIRYMTAYNDIAYRHIVGNQWYLRSHLPEVPVPRPPVPPVQFPNGSVVVKSAWVEMAGFSEARQRRFYTRTALVRDPNTGKCAAATVGLVGLHIVQKTPSRPQWIWSSFEQVDSVPPAEPGSPGTFTLHDGTDTPMPESNPLPLVPLAKQPAKPFNVVRSAKAPIHPNTVETNRTYRNLLKGTVWQNYQLAVTQWPLAPGDQSIPVAASQAGDIFQTFPGEGATSAFSNISMETFHQSRPAQGCMNCHNRARLTADFMWSVFMHAYPAKVIVPAAPLSRGK